MTTKIIHLHRAFAEKSLCGSPLPRGATRVALPWDHERACKPCVAKRASEIAEATLHGRIAPLGPAGSLP